MRNIRTRKGFTVFIPGPFLLMALMCTDANRGFETNTEGFKNLLLNVEICKNIHFNTKNIITIIILFRTKKL